MRKPAAGFPERPPRFSPVTHVDGQARRGARTHKARIHARSVDERVGRSGVLLLREPRAGVLWISAAEFF